MIHYQVFDRFRNIFAFTTEKSDGFSEFSRFTGDHPDVYSSNRELLAARLKIKPGQLVFPRQTHSDNVAVIDEIPETELVDTDAIITNKPGLCLCVQTADCVPILLFDPIKQVVGAIHAGWRGTMKKIVGAAIGKMEKAYRTDPVNIRAVIGPSICPEVYEVGAEVVEAFKNTFADYESFTVPLSHGRFLLNLWEANNQVLVNEGVNPENIEISGHCSYLDEGSFYSARRDGLHTGRIVSGLIMRS